jgi:hypothetical protein
MESPESKQSCEQGERGETWMLPESSLVYGSDAPFSGAGPGVLAGSDEELRARIVGTNALDTFQRLQAPAAIAA